MTIDQNLLQQILTLLQRSAPKEAPRVVTSSFAHGSRKELFTALLATEETVVSITFANGEAFTSKTIPAGLVIWGPVKDTDITVTSGTILAYRDYN